MSPATTELLAVWERGLNQTKLQKVLALLALAYPDSAPDDLAKLSIGERDGRLLQLRKSMFGSRFACMADCPRCSERVEWETDVDDICPKPSHSSAPSDDYTLEVDEFRVRFYLPNSADISAIIENGAEEATPENLLTRCILDSRRSDEVCAVEDLPDRVKQAVMKQMETEDSQADVNMLLDCPNCSHRWEAPFDIADYLLDEINSWAERTFLAVHRLASAYGWSQDDILAMSPTRRQIYLNMVNS